MDLHAAVKFTTAEYSLILQALKTVSNLHRRSNPESTVADRFDALHNKLPQFPERVVLNTYRTPKPAVRDSPPNRNIVPSFTAWLRVKQAHPEYITLLAHKHLYKAYNEDADALKVCVNHEPTIVGADPEGNPIRVVSFDGSLLEENLKVLVQSGKRIAVVEKGHARFLPTEPAGRTHAQSDAQGTEPKASSIQPIADFDRQAALKICEFLAEPKHIAAIAPIVDIEVSDLHKLLVAMELNKLIRRLPNCIYKRGGGCDAFLQMATSHKETRQDEAWIEEWQNAKARHSGMLLLMRIGDFYETYSGDAEVIAKALGLTITSRDGVAMAGFPHHSLETHLKKLLAAGQRVAVCEREDTPVAPATSPSAQADHTADTTTPGVDPVVGSEPREGTARSETPSRSVPARRASPRKPPAPKGKKRKVACTTTPG